MVWGKLVQKFHNVQQKKLRKLETVNQKQRKRKIQYTHWTHAILNKTTPLLDPDTDSVSTLIAFHTAFNGKVKYAHVFYFSFNQFSYFYLFISLYIFSLSFYILIIIFIHSFLFHHRHHSIQLFHLLHIHLSKQHQIIFCFFLSKKENRIGDLVFVDFVSQNRKEKILKIWVRFIWLTLSHLALHIGSFYLIAILCFLLPSYQNDTVLHNPLGSVLFHPKPLIRFR